MRGGVARHNADMTNLPPPSEMERAYMASDASYDGVFFLAVRTTGIFCKPSCRARKPLIKNVQFYKTVRESLASGYRPCLRCKPLEIGAAPKWSVELLHAIEQNPNARWHDQDLRDLSLNPAAVRRYFIKQYGMTFHSYCRSRRMGKAFEQIRNGETLTNTGIDIGYESHSGFRDAFTKTFGKPPGRVRDGACIFVTWLDSPLGPLVAGATNDGVCLLEFTDRRMLETQFKVLRKRVSEAIVPGENAHLIKLREEVALYFKGKLQNFSVKLHFPGTEFQQRVWNELLKIPYGETCSYETLAQRAGAPGASRAAGTANGKNRIAILIPCHRVVNKNGELGGYGGGLWRKQHFLDLERSRELI